mmetsp:Transcript_8956/g.16247  ORF Transcript_8956/g.16247 Transcript_8956/m.16247 type:complete len:109 (-) Transcript_8956:1055-1381(-)
MMPLDTSTTTDPDKTPIEPAVVILITRRRFIASKFGFGTSLLGSGNQCRASCSLIHLLLNQFDLTIHDSYNLSLTFVIHLSASIPPIGGPLQLVSTTILITRIAKVPP